MHSTVCSIGSHPDSSQSLSTSVCLWKTCVTAVRINIPQCIHIVYPHKSINQPTRPWDSPLTVVKKNKTLHCQAQPVACQVPSSSSHIRYPQCNISCLLGRSIYPLLGLHAESHASVHCDETAHLVLDHESAHCEEDA